jgi:hypothetical protein
MIYEYDANASFENKPGAPAPFDHGLQKKSSDRSRILQFAVLLDIILP